MRSHLQEKTWMTRLFRFVVTLGIAAFVLPTAAAAFTITVDFDETSIDGDSLKGSTGSLILSSTGTAGVYDITWSLDSSTFAGNATHNVVQSLAFKAFTSVSSVSVDNSSGPAGTLYWPSNVNNSNPNCDQDGSSAGFVCFDFDPDVATGGTIAKTFRVTGTVDRSLAWSFRGKYGPGNGWVMSASAPAVPEPSAALVFGAGLLLVAQRVRRRAL